MYEIEGVDPLPPAPPLRGSVVVRPGPDEVLDALTADLLVHSMSCAKEFGGFHLAVSGARAMEPLLRRLMYDPACRPLPWALTHLWVTDDRAGADGDPDRFRLLRETIVEQSGIPHEHVHALDFSRPDAHERYEVRLRAELAWRDRGQDRLDAVLLPLDDTGAAAGIEPFSNGAGPGDRLVIGSPGGGATLSLAACNASRLVAVLGIGERLRPAVQAASEASGGIESFPLRGLAPVSGELRWYLDAAACPHRSAGTRH